MLNGCSYSSPAGVLQKTTRRGWCFLPPTTYIKDYPFVFEVHSKPMVGENTNTNYGVKRLCADKEMRFTGCGVFVNRNVSVHRCKRWTTIQLYYFIENKKTNGNRIKI